MRLSYNQPKLIGSVQLPSSKSLSNRALMLQAFFPNKISIKNLSDANDTVLLDNILKHLQANIQFNQSETLTINAEDAGTTFRFLTAYLSSLKGVEFILTGTERMCNRPVNELVDALLHIGADISYIDIKGFPPLRINGKDLVGGTIHINASVSSQFISALCLLAPTLEQGLSIVLEGKIVSQPYIDMTLSLMQHVGIETQFEKNKISIEKQTPKQTSLTIENDWSSATFFYGMAMMSNHDVNLFLPNLNHQSLQGDSFIVELASHFGIETNDINGGGIRIFKNKQIVLNQNLVVDLTAYPDLAIPFIVACATCYPSVTIKGIAHLEYKESKRLTALTTELKKIGIELEYQFDILTFKQNEPIETTHKVSFHTYDDHRIAMALSMIALLGIEVILDSTECVQKSFPEYWLQLQHLGFEIHE
jgi:3-phosphoshikimate 1-carboxyvinyltransferase